MALIASIDGPNRDIYLTADSFVSDMQPMDIYKEMRALRRIDESLRKFDVFLTAKGYESKGGGRFTERYVICMTGTRIIPYNTTHELTVIGTIITDDGFSGIDCFDRSPLSPGVEVDINYIPPQVEIIERGTSGLTTEEGAALLQYGVDLSAIAANMTVIEGDIGLVQTDIASLQGDVASLDTRVGNIEVDITNIKNDIISIDTDIGSITLSVAEIQIDLAFVKAIESGEWKIENNQMIFYNAVSTEIARFNLFNNAGAPTNEDVYRRAPV